MVKIEKPSDFDSLDIKPIIKSYLIEYLNFFLKQYNCTDISEFGAFYLLENEKDLEKHKKMGLSLPLDKAIYEFTDLLTLKGNKEQIELLHSCFVLTNDYAISVFIEPKYTSEAIRSNLLDDYTERTIEVNV